MAKIDALIDKIDNPALRDQIKQEMDKLKKQKKFGLVFEEHLPESIFLYDVPVKKGAKVAKRADKSIQTVYTVLSIEENVATCITAGAEAPEQIPVADLCAVAEFGDPIYPYLKPIDSICNAPDSDLWHTLIEADNYHALQLLEYLYAGKVDCIYIDPPYNTGARDWKYNNDYVDGADQYRHSKWLSMMQKRLQIAKKLLNPKIGVMVIAIDDNELNSLGLLIDEVFSGYRIFCVTVVHNPNGNQGKNFGVTNEFLYFILPSGEQILSLENRTEEPDIRPLRDVSGNNNLRTDAKNCFYPIYVKENQIIGFGSVCPDEYHPNSANINREDGVLEIYPLDAKNIEKKWVFARNTVESIIDELRVEWNDSRKIWDIIRHKCHFTYKTVWTKKEYNANSYGSKLINAILGEKRFDYPKSLYAVHACMKAVCGNRKDSLIVDFFAGSGTTMHAVNLLNAEDGGKRRCILVTNNEVSDAEKKDFEARGIQPGDEEWEAKGIARYVTWPRTVCSIKGVNVKGEPLKGNYIGSEIPMADGFKVNAAFFKLSFLDKNLVALGQQLAEMMPTLWLKAGAHGPCPTLQDNPGDMLVLPENRFAILVNEAYCMDMVAELEQHPEIDTVYIVTDSEATYRDIIAEMPGKQTYQLYRDYLDNFRINAARR